VTKVFLQTKQRFWAAEKLNGFAYTDLPLGQVWNLSHQQPGPRGILMAYVASQNAVQLAAMQEAARINFVREQMEQDDPANQRGPAH
jgi:monoamine oxidase